MRDLFIRDWGWKLFSLFLAVAIWLTVHRILQEPTEQLVRSGESSLTYGNLKVLTVAAASDVHLYQVKPGTVNVTVSGPAEAVSKLPPNQIHVTVDLTDIGADKEQTREVEVSVPSGIKVDKIEPEEVSIIGPPKH